MWYFMNNWKKDMDDYFILHIKFNKYEKWIMIFNFGIQWNKEE